MSRNVALSPERIAELTESAALASVVIHEVGCPINCQACHDDNCREGITELLTERAALVAAFDGIGKALGTVMLDATALVMSPGDRMIEAVRVVREERDALREQLKACRRSQGAQKP